MRIWACSDLHLALGVDKPMDKFGDHWKDHHLRIAEVWDQCVAADDIVLSPGDLSWATKPDDFIPDATWLGERPGTVVMIKGNHDYWWPKSKSKLQRMLPDNTIALRKQGLRLGPVAIFGTRGGDFAPLTRYGDERSQADIDQALDKEANELERSIVDLASINNEQDQPPLITICLFHYPPIAPGMKASRFTPMIEQAGANYCIYGHLHGGEVGATRIEGEINDVTYRCTSCDQIDFQPILIADLGENISLNSLFKSEAEALS